MRPRRAKTKIICTIGPASDGRQTLRQLAREGMSVARLNFSHGSHVEHGRRIDAIRKLTGSGGEPVRILQDLEGYRMRIGSFPGTPTGVALEKDQIVLLTNRTGRLGPRDLPLDYEGPLTGIAAASRLYIDDGHIELVVLSRTATELRARVLMPGFVKPHKGINIPGFHFPYTGLTPKDRQDIEFGLSRRVEYIAQSFVRSARDVRAVRDRVKDTRPRVKLIAKIENREGVRNLDGILDAADGVMVARGDLGVSVPIHHVPMIQKMIIHKCNRRKKFVITATQMLESMTGSPRPTRAEVADVANAVLDGTDFVMLSAETAAGAHPVRAVKMMRQIVSFTEAARGGLARARF